MSSVDNLWTARVTHDTESADRFQHKPCNVIAVPTTNTNHLPIESDTYVETYQILFSDMLITPNGEGQRFTFPALFNTDTFGRATVTICGSMYPADEAVDHAIEALITGEWAWRPTV
jgi:hypothetical protein